MTEIISIINNKGGVGKTITSVNLAVGLAENYKVLLIDLDQQANATQYLNLYGISKYTINDIMFNEEIESENCILTKNIFNNTVQLDVIPSHKSFSNALTKLRLEEILSPQHFLKRALKEVLKEYDYVIIDCPPSLDMVTANALNISTKAIIPVVPTEFGIEGIFRVLEAIERVNSIYTEDIVSILGILFTRVENRTMVTKHIMKELKSIDLPIFNTYIRKTVKVVESESQKVPVIEYAPLSTASIDYGNLVKEIAKEI